MRSIGQLIGAIVVAAAVLVRAQAPPPPDAASVMAAAREALGGEKRLSAVKSFVATGRTKQVRGDNLVPIEFEIACELPDKYVRRDEIPAQESGPTSTGFNGSELIVLPVPVAPPAMPGRAGGAGPAPAAQMDAMRAARVATVKQDFVRLTLGMFAASFSSYPLTFTYAGQAEAPQGKADVIDVAGAGAPPLKMRLFINSQTHLPIMVSWQAPTGPMRGGMPGMPPGRMGGPPAGGAPGAPPAAAPSAGGAAPAAAPPAGAPPAAPPAGAPPAGAGRAGTPPPAPSAPGAPTPPPAATQGGPPAGAPAPPGAASGNRGGAAPPAPVEYRVYYGDYREVNGMQWPFRLRRATGPDTTEETTFDGFKINAKIDPKKFEVKK